MPENIFAADTIWTDIFCCPFNENCYYRVISANKNYCIFQKIILYDDYSNPIGLEDISFAWYDYSEEAPFKIRISELKEGVSQYSFWGHVREDGRAEYVLSLIHI